MHIEQMEQLDENNEFFDQIPEVRPSFVQNKTKEIVENIADPDAAKRKINRTFLTSLADSICGVQPMKRSEGSVLKIKTRGN